MNITNCIDGCYTNYFTYEEIMALMKYCKGIIGIRSGFLEILSTYNVPIYAIYPDIPDRGDLKFKSSKNNLSGFTLTKLPSVNSKLIKEYDLNAQTEEDLEANLLANFPNLINMSS